MKKTNPYIPILGIGLFSIVAIYIGIDTYHKNLINGDQLGYIGAIIGGALTLLGVWWTIKTQDEQRRDDLAIEYRPMIVIECFNQLYGTSSGIEFKYVNGGRGEALQVKYVIKDNETKYLSFDHNNLVQLMPTKESNTFFLQINWEEFHKHKDDFTLDYTMEFTYQDFLNLYTCYTRANLIISYLHAHKVCRVIVKENKISSIPNKGIKKAD